MQFANDRALVLLEIAKESPRFKDQAAYLAQLWLMLGALENQLGRIRSKENPVSVGDRLSWRIKRASSAHN